MNMWSQLLKVIIFGFFGYFLAIFWAPYLIKLLVWLKFWKKRNKTKSILGTELEVTKSFYEKDEATTKVPRSGGLLIWITTLAIALFFWFIFKIFQTDIGNHPIALFLNFVNRKQTFIPIGVMFFGAILGFVDDALSTLDSGGNYMAGGLKLSYRIGFVSIISLVVGLWFRLQIKFNNFIIIPKLLEFQDILDSLKSLIGNSTINNFLDIWLYILAILTFLVFFWSSSVIDGFDGLAAGTLIPIYTTFTIIAFDKEFYSLATFLSVMTGATIAYLWFNLPPAKFYMGDTGSASLLLTLGTVALFMNTLYLLPIAGIMLILTSLSNIFQVFSIKFFKKKLLKAAPLHHHFEALGYSHFKISVSYWLVSIVFCILTLIVHFSLN
jgi:phospho-N-acetylmuramoyl-pentapeptide-transferase